MRATLGLEYIGQAQDQRLRLYRSILNGSLGIGDAVVGRGLSRRPWVAQIAGLDARHGLCRTFLRVNTGHQHANGTGSRGVTLWFLLESGRLYEVSHNVSWCKRDRYFCAVTEAGDVERVHDAQQWLNDHSASTS